MGALTKANEGTPKPDPIKAFLEPIRKRAMVALPKGADKSKFYLSMYEAMKSTPKLADCDPESVYAALVTCAQLGLVPNGHPPQAWLIPRGGQCRLDLDYRGMMTLVSRDPSVASIYGGTVHENDGLVMTYGDGGKFEHSPARRDPGEVEAFYAYLSYKDNRASRHVYMTKAECEDHRDKYSQSGKGGKGPWATAFEAMAQKTCIKRMCTRMSMDPSAAEAVHLANRLDGQVVTMQGGVVQSVEVVDHQPEVRQIAPPTVKAPPTINTAELVNILTQRLAVCQHTHGVYPEQIAEATGWDLTRDTAELMSEGDLEAALAIINQMIEETPVAK